MKPKKGKPSTEQQSNKPAIFAILREEIRRAEAGSKGALATLWQVHHALARHLAVFGNRDAASIDVDLAVEILGRGMHMLTKRVAANDPKALLALATTTQIGCKRLREASERAPEFVAQCAEKFPFWPVNLATKRMYHGDANGYLTKIRVGTRSNPQKKSLRNRTAFVPRVCLR